MELGWAEPSPSHVGKYGAYITSRMWLLEHEQSMVVVFKPFYAVLRGEDQEAMSTSTIQTISLCWGTRWQ